MSNNSARQGKTQARIDNRRTGFGDLLTVEQAADTLAVSPNTVRNLIRTEGLPALRVGQRLVRIRRSDLDAFLKPYEGGQVGGWSHL